MDHEQIEKKKESRQCSMVCTNCGYAGTDALCPSCTKYILHRTCREGILDDLVKKLYSIAMINCSRAACEQKKFNKDLCGDCMYYNEILEAQSVVRNMK